MMTEWSEDENGVAISPFLPSKSWRGRRPAAGLQISQTHGTVAGKFLAIDVTALVKQWIEWSEPNFGIALIGTTNLGSSIGMFRPFKGTINSKENTGTGRAPRLQLVLSGTRVGY